MAGGQTFGFLLVFEDAPADVGVKPDQEGDGRVFRVWVECVRRSQEIVLGSIPFLWHLRHNTGSMRV
jgi:hypothetical protein